MSDLATIEVSALRQTDGVELWERHNAEALVGLACQVPAGRLFHAQEVNLQLERVHLARVRSTPHTVVRDRATVEQHPSNSLVVYAALRGEASWEQGGSRRILNPGDMVVCDADQPFRRGFSQGLEELAVKVRRDAFLEATGLSTLEEPHFVSASGPEANSYARALVRLVGRGLKQDMVAADEQTIIELVSVVAARGRVGLPTAHRAAARAFIDDHLSDPTLSATEVAAGAGISERHLSRLFAEAGSSIPQHILSRRLELAHTMLKRPESRHLRVAELAAQCGFTSTAYFSETFKRQFGATPGSVRRSTTS